MWKLKNTTITPTEGKLTMDVVAVLTDGTQDQEISFTVSTESEVKSTIVSNLKRLNDREKVVADATAGNFSITEEVVEVPQAVKDREQWFKRYAQLQKAQELITFGILTGSEKAITNTQTWLKANFKVEYLSDL